jgi:choline dehydrogenase-like flavoprotein
MGHVSIDTEGDEPRGNAEVVLTTADDLSLYDNGARDRPYAFLALDLATQKRLGIGNCALALSTSPKPAATRDTPAAAVEQLASSIENTAGRRLSYDLMSEEAPSRDSRVVLAGETDDLGQRRAGLEWRFTEADWKSLAASAKGLAGVLGSQGLGRMCWPVATEDLLFSMSAARHHMGTTRMAADPAQGVVDADCRVHGMANLYIAGSSVFPTSGIINPTLTLAALAIRLADHLKTKRNA